MKYLELAVLAAFIVVDELRNWILRFFWSLDAFTLVVLLFIVYYFRNSDWASGIEGVLTGMAKKPVK